MKTFTLRSEEKAEGTRHNAKAGLLRLPTAEPFSKILFGAAKRSGATLAFCLLPFALGFAGCTLIETRPDPSRFYVLDSPAPARVAGDTRPPAAPAWPFALAVARVQAPSYLDQPQLVSRSGGARVTFSEFNRWMEPVDKGATRVLANALARRLGAERVAMEPTLDTYGDGVLVQVTLLRFDGELGGEVVLAARYRVSSVYDGATLLTGETTLRRDCDGSDHPAYAVALGRLLDDFAAELAKSVLAGVTPGPGVPGGPAALPAKKSR